VTKFVKLATVKVAIMPKLAHLAKAEVWSLKCNKSGLVCTLSPQVLVMTVMATENPTMPKINVKLVKVNKFFKNEKLLKFL